MLRFPTYVKHTKKTIYSYRFLSFDDTTRLQLTEVKACQERTITESGYKLIWMHKIGKNMRMDVTICG